MHVCHFWEKVKYWVSVWLWFWLVGLEHRVCSTSGLIYKGHAVFKHLFIPVNL